MNPTSLNIEEMILHFRDTYKEIYVTTIGNDDYIWRTLTQKEHSEITEFAINEWDAFERICTLCVLYPTIDFVNGGMAYLPNQLAPQILDESGYGQFRKEQPLLQQFRKEVQNNFDIQAQILINRAFPYIQFEEMENWTKEKLLKYVARAEWSLHFIDQKKHIELLTEDEILKRKTETGEEIEEAPQTSIIELANMMRKQGLDPMFALRHLYEKEKPEYFEKPIIGGWQQADTMIAGIDAWREGENYYGRYNIIQQQIQKISRR